MIVKEPRIAGDERAAGVAHDELLRALDIVAMRTEIVTTPPQGGA